VGLLAGIGTLAIPGLGPFIAAGPIMGALSGAAVGATAGGVVGFLMGLGVPKYQARAYEERIQEGGYLVVVQTEASQKSEIVRDIMKENDLDAIWSVSTVSR
jgi:outer membrane lipoprotein SlyB